MNARQILPLTACCLMLLATSALAQEHIRVPERQTHTDVKAGPSSGSIVLVMISSGTVLPIVKRQGEWIQVKLSPDLRRRGIPMRWYKNEDLGFVHESTVEVHEGEPPPRPSQEPPPSEPPREYVRVPARQTDTDIKAGPGSGSIVLLLVPSGTILPVTGRRGEWIQVSLSPDLRRVGTPMRWYKNETTGYVHESTVEVFSR
ncbi:MAG TPA: hypothetical protein VFO14_08105 [Vicinamibacterales bacterium]|nr:hypothetical protein [Vicinamibacterales bacterium]